MPGSAPLSAPLSGALTCAQVTAEKDQLAHLRYTVKELREKISSYNCRSNLGFFDMEPLVQENDKLHEQLRQAQAEAAKQREISEPPASYFQKAGAYTIEVDLAIGEAISKANTPRNQVPLLFLIFARFFRIKLPTRVMKVPLKKLQGKMTYIAREVQYIPGRTHVKEVCAVLNAAHKLQVGVELLENSEANYCYISDGAESLQSEWLCQLLSRRDPDTGLQARRDNARRVLAPQQDLRGAGSRVQGLAQAGGRAAQGLGRHRRGLPRHPRLHSGEQHERPRGGGAQGGSAGARWR